MKNNPIYLAAREAKRKRQRRWFLVHIGAVALLFWSIALALEYGEGTHLLIIVPLVLYALLSGREE